MENLIPSGIQTRYSGVPRMVLACIVAVWLGNIDCFNAIWKAHPSPVQNMLLIGNRDLIIC